MVGNQALIMTIRAIVLPGLDGGADLRVEFVAALAPEFAATVLAYPNDLALDYDGLTEWVRERLPRDEAFVLIAESFSGPVAIKLAAARPDGLIGVVLTATFARALRLASLRFMTGLLPLRKLPMLPAMLLMMGRWSTREWKQRLRVALAAVDQAVLRRRLLAAATVDVAALVADIECPILYLRASRDRIVSPDSWAAIRDRSHNAVCIGIEGPHMLLQAKPLECAAAVKR
ncbi:MAG TPA: alpha/beta hydrolase [Lysobacter sp.]|nr:alpha/beta hydrolase [Lysobacter sp.]